VLLLVKNNSADFDQQHSLSTFSATAKAQNYTVRAFSAAHSNKAWSWFLAAASLCLFSRAHATARHNKFRNNYKLE
jgi:hypothetical protein